eukprot:TRINITY_DN2832_c0_g2_i1.p1 TRINITY_DN2832_c0_g2~~TRINITY_DN2832_c0_g2_i1.p1  ORF type:complete len:343 (-),score=142.25 TRINITY_DN2832_c0_g2_i1:725-1753(-)
MESTEENDLEPHRLSFSGLSPLPLPKSLIEAAMDDDDDKDDDKDDGDDIGDDGSSEKGKYEEQLLVPRTLESFHGGCDVSETEEGLLGSPLPANMDNEEHEENEEDEDDLEPIIRFERTCKKLDQVALRCPSIMESAKDLMKETQKLRTIGAEFESLRTSFLNFDIEDNFMQILQKMDFSEPSRMGAPSISQVAEAAARARAVAEKEEEDREDAMEAIEATLKQVDYMKELSEAVEHHRKEIDQKMLEYRESLQADVTREVQIDEVDALSSKQESLEEEVEILESKLKELETTRDDVIHEIAAHKPDEKLVEMDAWFTDMLAVMEKGSGNLGIETERIGNNT